MKDILIVAPTNRVYENSCKVVENIKYNNVDVKMGILNEGLTAANEFVSNGGKIIITRGGTFNLIRGKVTVPVVEIKVGTSDCIAAYNKIKDTSDKIGVIGFRNVIYGFESLSTLCTKELRFKEIKDEKEIPDIVNECKRKGITTFVGDVLVEEVIRELNCNGVLIDSEEESIETAIREAENILEASEYQIRKNHEIQTVMNSVRDNVIYTDKNGKITLYNKSAQDLFNISDINRLNIRDILPSYIPKGEGEYGKIYTVDDLRYIVNVVPVFSDNYIEGTVFSFQACDEISSLEHRVRRSMNENGFVAKYHFDNIVHESKLISETIETAKKFAEVDAPILISGKSGTGKELMCQSIHNWSRRSNGPFVAINCAAITPSLIESEFFGYDSGAFTGAKKSGKGGLFELAHKGTLFLDEISELPRELQGRLLRVLQEKQVMRIGGDKIIPVDVRIVCASNKDLRVLAETGEFRTDLYFRISILKLYIPSLEERKEDIIPLSEYFLELYSKKYGVKELTLDDSSKEILVSRKFEGNVRELEGFMEESTVLGSFDNIVNKEGLISGNVSGGDICNKLSMQENCDTLEDYADRYVQKIYEQTGESIKETCRILGISRSTLWRKIKTFKNKTYVSY